MKAYTTCEKKNEFNVFKENSNEEFVKMFTINGVERKKCLT